MKVESKTARWLVVPTLLALGAAAFQGPSWFAPATAQASVFGDCKDMSIKFVNETGMTITIPISGHRVKNPGSLEGWNSLTLGAAVNELADGDSESTQQTLSIKCVDDAEFEIHYSSDSGSYVQVFDNRDIEDKNATLKLTHH